MRLLLFPLCLWPVFAIAQPTPQEIRLPFSEGQCQVLENPVSTLLDSLYDRLAPGEERKLLLLSSTEERQRTESQLQSLSAKRADLVRNYFEFDRHESGRIHPVATPFEKKKPVKSKTTSNKAYRNFAQATPAIYTLLLYKPENSHTGYTSMAPPSLLGKRGETQHIEAERDFSTRQIYTFDPTQELVVSGSKGVQLRLKAGSLVQQNGAFPTCNEVTLILEEYLSLSDMLTGDLSTHSNGRMLQTGGMVYVMARCSDKEILKLKPGAGIEIYLPQPETFPEMRVFTGRSNPEVMDWKLSESGKADTYPLSTATVPALTPDPEELPTDEESDGDESAIDGYVLRSTTLGWINCDKFYDIPNATQLLAAHESKDTLCYRLIFPTLNSILPGYLYSPGPVVKFDQIPAGEEAIVVAYRVSADKKKAWFGATSLVTGEIHKAQLQLREIPYASLPEEFKRLLD